MEEGFKLDWEGELEVVSGHLVEDIFAEHEVAICQHEEDIAVPGIELIGQEGFLNFPEQVSLRGSNGGEQVSG